MRFLGVRYVMNEVNDEAGRDPLRPGPWWDSGGFSKLGKLTALLCYTAQLRGDRNRSATAPVRFASLLGPEPLKPSSSLILGLPKAVRCPHPILSVLPTENPQHPVTYLSYINIRPCNALRCSAVVVAEVPDLLSMAKIFHLILSIENFLSGDLFS